MQMLNLLKSSSSFFVIKQSQSLLKSWQILDCTYSPVSNLIWWSYHLSTLAESSKFLLQHPSMKIFAHLSSCTSWSSRLWLDIAWGKFIVWGSNCNSSTSPQIDYPLTSFQVKNWMFKSKMQIRDASVPRMCKQWSKWWFKWHYHWFRQRKRGIGWCVLNFLTSCINFLSMRQILYHIIFFQSFSFCKILTRLHCKIYCSFNLKILSFNESAVWEMVDCLFTN